MTINDVLLTKIKGTWGTDFSDSENGVAVIKTNNLSYEGEIDFTDICYRNIDKEKAKKLYLQNGDLLVEKSGGTRTHTVGYVNYFANKNDYFVCNNFILALRPDLEKIFPKYLFWQMRCMYETGRFSDCYNKTTGIQNLKDDFYLSKKIIVPSKDQQQKIATHLDKITEAINNKKKQLSLFDELVKSKFVEMFGDLETNPKKWNFVKFDHAAKIDGVMTTDYEKYADYPHIGIDSIMKNTGELVGYRTVKEDNVISGKYLFTHEHIIYSKIRPNLNKVALPDFSGLCSADSYPILVNSENCNRYYFAYVLRSDFFLSYILAFSSRAGMPKVNREQIRGFEFPLPPPPLQNQFADFVQKCDRAKATVKQEITCLQELLDSKMQDFFGNM